MIPWHSKTDLKTRLSFTFPVPFIRYAAVWIYFYSYWLQIAPISISITIAIIIILLSWVNIHKSALFNNSIFNERRMHWYLIIKLGFFMMALIPSCAGGCEMASIYHENLMEVSTLFQRSDYRVVKVCIALSHWDFRAWQWDLEGLSSLGTWKKDHFSCMHAQTCGLFIFKIWLSIVAHCRPLDILLPFS